MTKTQDKPLVSIIIPTRNSQETIEYCLQTIKQQTYARIETILLDRFSSDNTLKIAKKFDAQIFTFDCERSAAKNYGAKKAHGQFLLFIDSDMMLDRKVVEECVKKHAKNNVDAVTIPEIYVSHGLFGEYRKTEKTSLSKLKDLLEIPRFFKKDAFLKIGGFDEKLVCGEDFDLFQRFKNAGYKTEKTTFPISHFEDTYSLGQIMLKAYYYGRSLPALIKKNPKNVVRRYGKIRLASVKNTGMLIKNPQFFIGFVSVKVFESAAYISGISIELILNFFRTKIFKKLTVKTNTR